MGLLCRQILAYSFIRLVQIWNVNVVKCLIFMFVPRYYEGWAVYFPAGSSYYLIVVTLEVK
jgi:hypothetical protein